MSAETFPAPGAAIPSAHSFSPWSATGRIGRARLLAYSLASQVALLAVAFLLALFGTVGGFLAIIALIGAGVVNIGLMVRRSHDLDVSGWWTILAILIPFAALYWLLRAGTPGPNRYGAAPPPNTTGVMVLAWILPLVFIVGVLAAIALPAYQDYTVKAKLNQVILSLSDCRARVVSAYRDGRAANGSWGCNEGGAVGPYARALEMSANGAMAVVLQNTGTPALEGRRLTLEPVDASGATPRGVATAAIVGFRCVPGGGLDARYFPASCTR